MKPLTHIFLFIPVGTLLLISHIQILTWKQKMPHCCAFWIFVNQWPHCCAFWIFVNFFPNGHIAAHFEFLLIFIPMATLLRIFNCRQFFTTWWSFWGLILKPLTSYSRLLLSFLPQWHAPPHLVFWDFNWKTQLF